MFLLLIGIVILLFGILVLRDFWLYTKEEYQVHKKFPATKTRLFFGTISDILFMKPEEVFQFMRQLSRRFKITYSHWWNGYLILNIIVGKDAEQVLNNRKCLNKSMFYKFLQPFMGTGLLTSGGQKWQHRRKILTPAFHFNILQQQFHTIFKNETDQLIVSIINNKNRLVHLQDCMSRFTLNTVCETAMGVKLSSADESNEYRRQIYEIGEMLVYRVMRPWLRSNTVYRLTGYAKKFDKIIVPVHNFTRQVIKERRQMFQSNKIKIDYDRKENIYATKKTRYAMLDTLLAAEAQGENITIEGIREEVDTFMFEGHDTTSAALTFTLFLLAENPNIQQKLYEEIHEFAKMRNIDDATMHHLNELNYLDCVIKESLRIFPPVPFISRITTEKMKFNDMVLPVNTVIHFHIYDLHRDESQFPDPEKFDPDRFLVLAEETEKRHPFAYLPFSAGQRNCIGQKFALLEMKTLLIKLILNFQLEQVTKRDELVFIADLVLRTKKPIIVKFNLRYCNDFDLPK